MNRLLKSLSEFLYYLGRGASPVDGMYWTERTPPPRASVCDVAANVCQVGANKVGTNAKPASAGRNFSSGYRVLM
jgi:hypothetical protein